MQASMTTLAKMIHKKVLLLHVKHFKAIKKGTALKNIAPLSSH